MVGHFCAEVVCVLYIFFSVCISHKRELKSMYDTLMFFAVPLQEVP